MKTSTSTKKDIKSNQSVIGLVASTRDIVRKGLVAALATSIPAIGEAKDLNEVRECNGLRKDSFIIVEFNIQYGFRREDIAGVQKYHQGIPIMVVSDHYNDIFAREFVQQGIKGYLPLTSTDAIAQGAAKIRNGGFGLEEQVATALLQTVAEGKKGFGAEEVLTSQQLNVFYLTGMGYSVNKIAAELRLSYRTVEGHKQDIRERLGYADALELTQRATLYAHALSSPNLKQLVA